MQKRIAFARSHSHFSFLEVNSGWSTILKFAERLWLSHQYFPRHLKFSIQSHTVRSLFGNCRWVLKYVYLAIWWAIYWQLKEDINLICPQKVLDQNFTLWTSVSFSLMVIGWEDCRMIGAISASSSGWEKVWVSSGKGFFSSLFSLFSCVCFIYLALSVS